ncbi:MAG: ATP synthase subunit alpha [Pirellulaceae bacterium]|nr:MAG: ATP synthase subunit alpha [Pirellulaceae bacterium]
MQGEPGASRLKIEIAVILAGRLDRLDRHVIEESVNELSSCWQRWMEDFDWQLRVVVRDEWPIGHRVEPMELLSQARQERDESGWDFVIVITAADLISHYKPSAIAVISSSLDIAVVSTARIDPRATSPHSADSERMRLMKLRATRLMLYAMGHWLGVEHDDESATVMDRLLSLDPDDASMHFSDEQLADMKHALHAIADQRLEEREEFRRTADWRFYVLAMWQNRQEIIGAVGQARPWEFPVRLSRFATAALSATMVFLMTAEAWDFSMKQPPRTVVIFFVLSLVATTFYVTIRQNLLVRRIGRRLSEQIVATNVSALMIIALGMLTMFAMLVMLSLTAAFTLFPKEVVQGWAASVQEPLVWSHYLLLAGMVGTLGILIGALGATFEEAHHFQHVVFVDEEI